MANRLPSVLVVVLDCVRQSDFVIPHHIPDRSSAFAEIAKSAWVYSRAVSPATWTLPSHASIFTGVNPWQHSCFSGGSLRLSSRYETLPETFRRKGYRTACFSANGWVSEATGLVRGFETAYWGRWGSWLSHDPHPNSWSESAPSSAIDKGRRPTQVSGLDRLWSVAGIMSSSYPGVLDFTSRLIRGIEGRRHPHQPHWTGWIEPAFEDFVLGLDPREPFFAFVNFLEAHEPLLAGADDSVGLRKWLSVLSHISICALSSSPRTPASSSNRKVASTIQSLYSRA